MIQEPLKVGFMKHQYTSGKYINYLNYSSASRPLNANNASVNGCLLNMQMEMNLVYSNVEVIKDIEKNIIHKSKNK